MDAHLPGEVTRELAAWRGGDDRAIEESLPHLYDGLRRLARRYLGREHPGLTLRTQDLVHETFLRLIDQRHVDWRNRSQFFAIAARMMRRILVDGARRRLSGKHGGGLRQVALDSVADFTVAGDPALLALDQALVDLAAIDPGLARIVDLRFFGGLEQEEIATLLGISISTVWRRWRTARAWLYRRLREEATAS
jgi:RNA polymerase sigma factor (TIGR02999 family)